MPKTKNALVILIVTIAMVIITRITNQSLLTKNDKTDLNNLVDYIYKFKNDSIVVPADYVTSNFFDKDNQQEIDRILKDEIGIKTSDDELSKTIKISDFIINKTRDLRGSPPPFEEDSFFQFWKKIEEKKVVVACFELSAMYAFFANNADLITRVVNIRNDRFFNEVRLHTVAESFNYRQQRWYMVDLTYYQAYVEDENNNLLNTIEYGSRIKVKKTDNLKIHIGKTLIIYNSRSGVENIDRLKNQTIYYDGRTTLFYDIEMKKRLPIQL